MRRSWSCAAFSLRLCRENKLLALAPCPPETADAEIKKDHDNYRGCDEGAVIGALLPACPCAPQNRAENQDRQQEENAGNLKPDLAADTAKRLEKSAKPPRYAPRGMTCSAAPCGSICFGRARLCLRSRRIALLAFAHDGLARKATRHTHTHSQNTADGFRSHFDMQPRQLRPVAGDPGYDGSSGGPMQRARIPRRCHLPDGRSRSKV
jgi:hypothetical protein